MARGLCSRHYQRWRRGASKEPGRPGRKPKHSKEVREKFGGSPKYEVRMDLQLYEWVKELGGPSWIRQCLEFVYHRWDDPDFAPTKKQLLAGEEPDFFTLEFLAKRFSVDQATLERWCENGHLPGRPAGRGWKVPLAELSAFEATTLKELQDPSTDR